MKSRQGHVLTTDTMASEIYITFKSKFTKLLQQNLQNFYNKICNINSTLSVYIFMVSYPYVKFLSCNLFATQPYDLMIFFVSIQKPDEAK